MLKIFFPIFVGIVSLSVTAHADIIIYNSLEGGSGDVQNVLFSDANKDEVALTVDGFLNQTGEIVNFTGTEDLMTPSSGQARIEAYDGSFTELFIEFNDPTLGFDKVQFNIDAEGSGWVELIFTDQYSVDWSGDYELGSGSNWFTAIGIYDQIISSVQISSTVQLTALTDLTQIRLNPISTAPIPEPATMLLFGTGLIGLAGARLRRKKI